MVWAGDGCPFDKVVGGSGGSGAVSCMRCGALCEDARNWCAVLGWWVRLWEVGVYVGIEGCVLCVSVWLSFL
jgi:hypothetical protein